MPYPAQETLETRGGNKCFMPVAKVWQHDWCLARAFLGLDMAAWNGCSSAAKLGMLVNVPQLTIMHCTCAADLRNLGIFHFVFCISAIYGENKSVENIIIIPC